MVAEYDSSNDPVASYVQGLGIDRPISMYRGGEMYWYHTDALGSVYQMTDEDETVVRTYDYSAFGTIISETGSISNPFTYTAREYEQDSGLYYYRARYYDVNTGRFIQADPSGMPDGPNRYVYVINSPIGLSDPSGLEILVGYRPAQLPGFLGNYLHCYIVVRGEAWNFSWRGVEEETNKSGYQYEPTTCGDTPYCPQHEACVKREIQRSRSMTIWKIWQPNRNCCHWVKYILCRCGLDWPFIPNSDNPIFDPGPSCGVVFCA